MLTKPELENEKTGMQGLIADPTCNAGCKAEAQQNLQEINTAINVIEKAPVIANAAALTGMAVDLAGLGAFAAGRALTSTVVREFFASKGTTIGEDAAAAVARAAPNGSTATGRAVDPATLLTANGVKFTRENVIATGRTPGGQIVFLETGTANSGFQHIVQEHATDFANVGISQADIPSVVMRAVTEGKIVGYQGRGTNRPIYEIAVKGQPQRIAITTGSNGYIVGANPAGRIR